MPTIDFLWNEWDDNLFQETNDSGVVTSYITMPGQYGEVLYDQQGNRFAYYHYDGNGSTRKLTGANQAVTKTYIFTGFGELIANPGLGSTPFAYKGAAGYYTNPITDDIYVRARSYEPTIGRWLSKDPLGFVDGPNLYAAYFAPSGIDPRGQFNIPIFGGGGRCCFMCIRLSTITNNIPHLRPFFWIFNKFGLCVEGCISVNVFPCCDNNGRLRSMLRFSGCVGVSLRWWSSLGSGAGGGGWGVGSAWGPWYGRCTPQKRKGRIGPNVGLRIADGCPPEGCHFDLCFCISFGYSYMNFGIRVCLFPELEVEIGQGPCGVGTGVKVEGCLECNKALI